MRKILLIIGLVIMFGMVGTDKIKALSGTCVCNAGIIDSGTNGCDGSAGKQPRCLPGLGNSCSCYTDSEWNAIKDRSGGGWVEIEGKFFRGLTELCSDTDVCIPNAVCDAWTNRCRLVPGVLGSPCDKGNCVPGLKCVNDTCERDPSSTCGEFGQDCCVNKWVWGEKSCVRIDLMCSNSKCVMNCLPNQPDCGGLGKPCYGSGKGKLCDYEKGLICDVNTNTCIGDGSGSAVGDAVLPKYPDEMGFKFANSSMGDVIGGIIKYIYIFAGFALIVVLITGGFSVLTSAGVPEKAKLGYDKITQALTGFIIVFLSYMVVLLIQAIFKIKIFF